MRDLMMEFPETVSDARGTFRAWAVAGEGRDGRWDGWLEFVPADRDTSIVYATPIEMRRDDRALMAEWAAGLTHVYATLALSRATIQQEMRPASQSPFTLEGVVEALDRLTRQSGRWRIRNHRRRGSAARLCDAAVLRFCGGEAMTQSRRSDLHGQRTTI